MTHNLDYYHNKVKWSIQVKLYEVRGMLKR